MPIHSLRYLRRTKKKILSFSVEGALLTDTYGHGGHSPSDRVGLKIHRFGRWLCFRHQVMKLSLLGPLHIRQYRNILSDGPSNSFHTFTL